MRHLEYGKCYPTLLVKSEINNPFMVLDEILGNYASAERVQDECWDLFTIAFRPFYWMKFKSPLVIYQQYKKIIKLIEAGWLISLIRPDYNTRGNLSEPMKQRKSNERVVMPNVLDHSLSPYRTLIQSYTNEWLFDLRLDLHEFMIEGMNLTCGKYESSFGEYIHDRYQRIYLLIEALLKIRDIEKGKDLSVIDKNILSEFIMHASDNNKDPIYIYDNNILDLFRYPEKEIFENAIETAYYILCKKDYWQLHNNPGDILYCFHDFLFIIESFWDYYCSAIVIVENREMVWEVPEEVLGKLKHLKKKEMKKPLNYLMKMFEEKSIGEWREDLESWKEKILSNNDAGYDDIIRFGKVKNFLLKLIDIAVLLPFEPEYFISNHD